MTEVAPASPSNVAAVQGAIGLGSPPAESPPAPPAGTEEKMFPESYVKQLRDENAGYRIAARDAATQVREATLGEVQPTIDAAKHEATRLQDELGSAWIGQAKLESALVAVLGEEQAQKVAAFAGALQGVDGASIKSSAENLRQLFNIQGNTIPTPGATDPSQGRGQRGLANPASDPMLQALINAGRK